MPDNKAFRNAMGAALTAKMAANPHDLSELFAGGGVPAKPKAPKVKKELTPEEEKKKVFDRNLTQNLVCKDK